MGLTGVLVVLDLAIRLLMPRVPGLVITRKVAFLAQSLGVLAIFVSRA
jgi:hypothetical protein